MELSQELNNTVKEKKDVICGYSLAKTESLEFKKTYYNRKLSLEREKINVLRDILMELRKNKGKFVNVLIIVYIWIYFV